MEYIVGAGNILNILYAEKYLKENNIDLSKKGQ